MEKKDIRKQLTAKLINIDTDTRANITKNLVKKLVSSDMWKQAECIGITVSGGFEWDTAPIIEQGWKEGKTILVPKCFPEHRRLEFYRLESFDQLEDSFYNLREPNPEVTEKVEKKDIDLLIVPGLGFNESGYRVGFGGGYYDRFLSDYPNKTLSILSSEQLLHDLPVESFDIPVQSLLTEKGFLK